jgi:hypothetical protein
LSLILFMKWKGINREKLSLKLKINAGVLEELNV